MLNELKNLIQNELNVNPKEVINMKTIERKFIELFKSINDLNDLREVVLEILDKENIMVNALTFTKDKLYFGFGSKEVENFFTDYNNGFNIHIISQYYNVFHKNTYNIYDVYYKELLKSLIKKNKYFYFLRKEKGSYIQNGRKFLEIEYYLEVGKNQIKSKYIKEVTGYEKL